MPTQDAMTVSERRKYLKRMYVRYVAARRGERGSLRLQRRALDESRVDLMPP